MKTIEIHEITYSDGVLYKIVYPSGEESALMNKRQLTDCVSHLIDKDLLKS